ncbi:MAG: replication restart helicase PriA [Candidatus Binatia bacterium]
MMVVQVAVIPPIPDHEVLLYSVPGVLADRVREGARVLVPLGPRQVTGIVVGVDGAAGSTPLKDLLDVPDEEPLFSSDLLALVRFTSSYYMASLGEVLATAVLAGLRAESRRVVRLIDDPKTTEPARGLGRVEREILRRLPPGRAVSTNHLLRSLRSGHDAIRSLAERGLVEITEQAARAAAQVRYEDVFFLARDVGEEEVARLARQAPAQSQLLERIRAAGPDGVASGDLGGARAKGAVRALVERGWIRAERREAYRKVVGAGSADSPPSLTASQAEAMRAILEASGAHRFGAFLLRGVTGSGKTEVYLRSVEQVIARGRGAMLLVPEIALTEELVRLVFARFGSSVALLHSSLSPGERWDEWRRLARREARVLVGVRSAVFAPLPDLGLVIVDEEHDGAYKQEDGLHYNARDLAVVRARDAKCPIVLGSATPSIESYWNATSGRYRLIELPERIERRPLPEVELIDLRTERPEGEPAIFSPRLRDALAETLASGSQSLVFLNRRGYAHYLQCTLCGNVMGCPNCSVTLTFHLRRRLLRCHHCDYRLAAPDVCPECSAPSLRDVGVGTEQVEAALHALLPAARIARMDRDTMSRKGAQRAILTAWREGSIDVLVGTQMVTKGHDIPGITLVGVIAADQALNFPDFRAAERTFQMLTQVAGRAGRGERPGRVLIQTYRPGHYALEHATKHDFAGFASREVGYREALAYPPYSRLVNLRLDGLDASRVEESARALAASLRRANGLLSRRQQAKILGPAPAPLERLRGRFRWQLLLKAREPRQLRALVHPAVDAARRAARSTVRIAIDVDPYGML